jgi:hypothetical protein
MKHAASSTMPIRYMEQYVERNDDQRRAEIETGFLEHALETVDLGKYFENWASDPRFDPAWNRALESGKADPVHVARLFERLQRKTDHNS